MTMTDGQMLPWTALSQTVEKTTVLEFPTLVRRMQMLMDSQKKKANVTDVEAMLDALKYGTQSLQ